MELMQKLCAIFFPFSEIKAGASLIYKNGKVSVEVQNWWRHIPRLEVEIQQKWVLQTQGELSLF